MIKHKLKSMKGITLTSLAVTIIILFIITGIIIYNVQDNFKIKKLRQLQNDVENLKDKVSSYYIENGVIPAKIEYPDSEIRRNIDTISEAVDTGKFFVLDLAAMDNLTLNYGRDYENVKDLTKLDEDQIREYTDLYIINENSHNIFYVKGVRIGSVIYYTNYTEEEKDKVEVELIQ